MALHSLLEGWLVVSTYRLIVNMFHVLLNLQFGVTVVYLIYSTYRATSPPPTLTTMHKMTWAVQITAWCTAIQVDFVFSWF